MWDMCGEFGKNLKKIQGPIPDPILKIPKIFFINKWGFKTRLPTKFK